ncbi:MAG: translocation protein TolB [Cyclobacteriaceae bacterium]|nr:translocation protein TolB [Cyclobacteriaceae bacterium]
MIKKLLIVVVWLLLPVFVFAQAADEVFGKNRIQYRQFEWKSLLSENFELFYYGNNEKVARETIYFLEEKFDMITDMMGYPPYSRTKLFIYSSIIDLQQSNVGIDYVGPIHGGATQFVKSYIEIAHQGTISEYKEELLYKVSKLLLNEFLYGGSLKDMLQNTLMNLPEWFTEGAALYISKGWSIEMDDFVREYVTTTKTLKLQKLHGKEAALIGQSIWNYIAERHGKSNISNILNHIRIIRNEEKSISFSLGTSFRALMRDWKNFYTDMDKRLDVHYTLPDGKNYLVKKNKRGFSYNSLKISPDGLRLAYATNDRGKYSVVIKDITTGVEKLVLSGGQRVINQDVDYSMPLLDWVDDNTLGVISYKAGQHIFWLYDISTGSKIPNVLNNLSQVKSMSFSANGRLGVLSATVNGENDLFLLSTRRNRLRRLTNDLYDDINAVFVPNTNTILFSSNRTTDTLNLKRNSYSEVTDNYNLFFYNLDTTTNIVHRITNTISKDTQPLAANSDEIIYLSDQKGIANIYKYNRSTGIYSQITNYKRNIKAFDINFSSNALTIISQDNRKEHIFFVNGFNTNQQNFTPPSGRQQILQAKTLKTKLVKEESTKGLSVKEIIDSRLRNIEKENSVEEEKEDTVSDSTEVKTEEVEILDTENYVFDKEQPAEAEISVTPRIQYQKTSVNRTLLGPYPYQTPFSADRIVTSFVIDPLRGFGIRLETQMNDLLENHKFNGGMMTSTDLRNGDLFTEYVYLKSKIDYKIRYERSSIFWEKWNKDGNTIGEEKYFLNGLYLGAYYPINVKSRAGIAPFIVRTTYNDLGNLDNGNVPRYPPSYLPNSSETYAGAKFEFVFDNSISPGMNLKEGTRGKLTFSHYENLKDRKYSFSNLFMDVRHYQKIHREIVVAGRLVFGSFFGNAPKSYLLGGMDNWVFSSSNKQGNSPINPERTGNRSDLLFMRYITPLRGYDYANLFGSNVLALSTELRIPLIKYLNSGYISSNFFRNIQFIGFWDMGSSWSGKSPFNRENTISSAVIEEGAFKITINNYRSPWMASYGAGFRTMILGYYMKFDLAWPIEEYKVSDPRLSITLGLDF